MVSLASLEAALAVLTAPVLDANRTSLSFIGALQSELRERLQAQLQSVLGWTVQRSANTVGLGIAEKKTRTGGTGDLALVVYTEKKLPRAQLPADQVVPSILQLAGIADDIVTDVREIGRPTLEMLTTEVRPIVCGYSAGGAEPGTTGTVGCLVTRRGDPTQTYVLSNSHVFAKSGLGAVGDPIYQPGADDAPPNTAVATLVQWQPFTFSDTFEANIDAAIAAPAAGVEFNPTVYNIGLPKGVRPLTRGMTVQKSGRTTEYTTGTVQDINFHTQLLYPRPDGSGDGSVRFANLALCTRYTAPGDSGSLVLDSEGYAVGLHFCGTPTVSICIPIQVVLDTLGVDLVTGT